MRFNEFAVKEEYLKVNEEDTDSAQLAAVLVSVLEFIRSRSEEQGAPAKISTNSLLNLVKNVGHPNFGYRDLVDAHEQMEAVKNMISSFNEQEVVLRTEGDEEEEQTADMEQQPQRSPEETVDSMAKSALRSRE